MTQITITFGNKAPSMAIDATRLGITADQWNANPALRYVAEYGLKQSLNDAIAGIKTTDADYTAEKTTAIVLKRLDAIMSGSVRTLGPRESVDPVAAEMLKVAREWFRAQGDQDRKVAMTNARKAGVVGKDAEVITAIVKALVADSSPYAANFAAEAERRIAEKKASVARLGAGLNVADLFAAPAVAEESDDDESDDN